MSAADKLFDFEVSCDGYPTIIVSQIGPDSATLTAAERWGANWTEVAGQCNVKKLGRTLQPRCRRCGKEMPRPIEKREHRCAGEISAERKEESVYTGLCSDCARMMRQYRRDAARVRTKDKRAGVGK